MRRILIVDDEAGLRDVLDRGLADPGFATTTTGSGADALRLAQEQSYDVVVLDIRLPDMDGIEVLRQLKEVSPDTEVIMLTADATLERGLQAMRSGAYDYVTKPAHIRALKELCLKAVEKVDLRRKTSLLERELSFKTARKQLVGSGPAMRHVHELIAQVAPANSSVLITGESGTGKELVARAIHDLSPRARGAFIAVNCGAFQETLLESELFGHRRGAFTGAILDKPGLFDVADGGTLFLDEIGEMTLPMQVKLLRVLDTRRFRPLGDTRERSVDIRVLAATNRDLRQMIGEKAFREDLYYRLNVVSVELPPLRERLEDIPELVEHLLRARAGVRARIRPSSALFEAFRGYHWPGNVRELENQLERSLILSRGEALEPIGFPPRPAGGSPWAVATAPAEQRAVFASSPPAREAFGSIAAGSLQPDASPIGPMAPAGQAMTLEQQEQASIMAALERFHGNVSRSAKALGIDRRTLHRKLKAYGLRGRD